MSQHQNGQQVEAITYSYEEEEDEYYDEEEENGEDEMADDEGSGERSVATELAKKQLDDLKRITRMRG